MIFQGRDEHTIMRRLKAVGPSKLREALAKRGLENVSTKELTDVLTGKHQSGWSQAKLRNTVEAFQDLKLAREARSASAMVLTASREAQDTAATAARGNELLKSKMRHMVARERGTAETEPETGAEPVGVLDRMRGAQGRANASERGVPTPSTATASAGTIRELRERWREELGIKKNKIQLPKPKNGQNGQNKPGFEA
jgi:hypothetical protein